MNAAGRMESIMAGRRCEVQRNRQSEGRENRHSEVRRHRYNEDRARHVVPDPVECRANTRVRRLCTPAPAPGPPSVLELEERLELGESQQLANAGWRVGEVGDEVTLTRPLLHEDEHAESAGIDLARLAKIDGDPPGAIGRRLGEPLECVTTEVESVVRDEALRSLQDEAVWIGWRNHRGLPYAASDHRDPQLHPVTVRGPVGPLAHFRQPDDLALPRFLTLRPRLAAGVLLSGGAAFQLLPGRYARIVPTRTTW